MICSDCKEKERNWTLSGSITNCDVPVCENFKGEIPVIPDQEPPRRGRGRPATVNSKGNKEYYRQYYHATKKSEMCECGIKICTKARSRHVNSMLHIKLMKNKQESTDPELNICNII